MNEKITFWVRTEGFSLSQSGDLTEVCRSGLLAGVSVWRYEVACDQLVMSSVGTGGECQSQPTVDGPTPPTLETSQWGFHSPWVMGPIRKDLTCAHEEAASEL